MNSTYLFQPLLIMVFFLFCSPNSFSQTYTDKVHQEITSYFENWNSTDTPGGSIAVVHNGKVVYSEGFGSADLENQTPITPTTKFNLQSLSNQVVAFAILLLESKGQLSVEDDLRTHIPEMPNLGKPIKIKHLLTHTHGLPDFIAMQFVAGWSMEDIKSRKEGLELLYQLEKNVDDPGERFNFSLSSFLLASEVVARVSDMPYAQFAKTNIFEPLGMKNTLYSDGFGALVTHRADSYAPADEGFRNETQNRYALHDFTLYSTAEDMAKWMINFSTPKIGNSTILRKIDTPISLNDGKVTDSTPGQFISTYKGITKIEHNGMGYGNLCYIARFPDQDFGVVVLGNAYNFSAREVALKTVDLFLKEHINEDAPIAEDSAASPSEAPAPKTINMDVAELKKFCGAYWNIADSYSRQIVLRDNKLFYHRSEGNESEMAPINKNTFILVSNPNNYSISFEKKNNKDAMIFSSGNDDYIHEKYEPVSYSANELQTFTGTYYCENLSALYHLTMKDGKLVAKHLRKEGIMLNPTKKDTFGGDQWFFSNINFTRNAGGNVNGFRLVTADVGDHFFRKID